MKFNGTQNYVATEDLKIAVNAAVTLERPLLVKGEPGTGKTELAKQVANSLGLELYEWNIKSTTKAQQGLYEYDAVSRLRDSQLGDKKVEEVKNYIKKGKLWQAFESDEKVVLLIDEVDKADIEFPNDLLQELDKMAFHVYETGENVTAKKRPVVIITSNNEKELPDALRWGPAGDFKFKYLWANIYREGEYTTFHSHHPEDFTMVYFLTAHDGDAPLLFEDSKTRIYPEEGLIALFPAYLRHGVPKHISNNIRMTLSGDVNRIKD